MRLFKVAGKAARFPKIGKNRLVPIYKGKGDKKDCSNYRGISLSSVVGKIYGRELIEKVKNITNNLIGEEQCGFRDGRGCVDQVFTLKILAEKYSEKKKDIFACFLDLEKAYDRVQREKLWEVLVGAE